MTCGPSRWTVMWAATAAVVGSRRIRSTSAVTRPSSTSAPCASASIATQASSGCTVAVARKRAPSSADSALAAIGAVAR